MLWKNWRKPFKGCENLGKEETGGQATLKCQNSITTNHQGKNEDTVKTNTTQCLPQITQKFKVDYTLRIIGQPKNLAKYVSNLFSLPWIVYSNWSGTYYWEHLTWNRTVALRLKKRTNQRNRENYGKRKLDKTRQTYGNSKNLGDLILSAPPIFL